MRLLAAGARVPSTLTACRSYLLDRGAPTNLFDEEPGAMPLAWAIKRGYRHMEELLRTAGARV